MSRPNRFILNSDYMSMAQASNYEKNVVLPAGRSTSYIDLIDKDIAMPTVKGAIPRYLVSYQTAVYNMETQRLETKEVTMPTFGGVRIRTSENQYPTHSITFSRKDADTLRVYDVVQTFNSDQQYDSLTFKLRQSLLQVKSALVSVALCAR